MEKKISVEEMAWELFSKTGKIGDYMLFSSLREDRRLERQEDKERSSISKSLENFGGREL